MIQNQRRQEEIEAAPLPRVRVPAKVRGKVAAEYLNRGMLLAGRYKIEKMIGGGGFGQIYRAIDVGTVVAVKVEAHTEEGGRMVLEQIILAKLNGTRHSPKIYYCGAIPGYNFIAMQMLGRNLTDLRKALTKKRFSAHTTVRVGIQIVNALSAAHELGYLHRDVKPSNMCVGIGEHRRIVYVVDYGMTRQFRTPWGVRRQRVYAAFRGTMRYVSLAVHDRREQGPVDDLWSVYYTLIELAESTLPWRMVTDHDEIFQHKRQFRLSDHCRHLPAQFDVFAFLLKDLQYDSAVPYNDLEQSLRKCCKLVDDEADFEWDDDGSGNHVNSI